MPFGPIQILVVGFEDPEFDGSILEELRQLREHDVVRLVDLLVVRKDDEGNIERFRHSDLSKDELEEFGATAGALIGLGEGGDKESMEAGAALGAATIAEGGTDPDTWYVDDAIPNGTAAAIALLEHRWAIGFRDAIRKAGGFPLADAWLHASDLVDVGVISAEDAETHAVPTRS